MDQQGGILGLMRPQYDTPLSPQQEAAFQIWKMQNAPRDTGQDYDLRGAYLAQFARAANGHMGDQFKKPNHPTFSNQSQYATPYGAGHWAGPEMGNGSVQTQSYVPSFLRQLLGR